MAEERKAKKRKAKKRVTSRPYGKLQVVRTKRKIFGKVLQARFFAELVGTCNVRGSARAAGVSWQCVYQRKDRDPVFRAALREALSDGYALLEWRMLAEANGKGEGPPAEAPLDKDLALHLLREHKRGLAGSRRGGAPELRSAEWSEVECYFIARLRALRVRLDGGNEGEPLHHPSDGSPPQQGPGRND